MELSDFFIVKQRLILDKFESCCISKAQSTERQFEMKLWIDTSNRPRDTPRGFTANSNRIMDNFWQSTRTLTASE